MLIYASPGAQGCLCVVPENASIANRVFASFLASLPPTCSDSLPVAVPLDDALQRLADLMHDPEIRNREPSSPMAFSCVPSVAMRRRAEIYARAALGHRGAFSPLDPNGRPKRRYVVPFSQDKMNGSRRACVAISAIRNASRSSGSRWTGTGYHTQVRIGIHSPSSPGVVY